MRVSAPHASRLTILLLLSLTILIACGKEGPVRPTIYDLPSTPTLSAVQEGGEIKLSISRPVKRASGAPLKAFRSIELNALILPLSKPDLPKPPPVATLLGKKNRLRSLTADWCAKHMKGDVITVTLPVEPFLDDHSWVALQLVAVVIDERGKHSEPSTLLSRILALPPPAPTEVEATSRPDGLELSWKAENCKEVRISRTIGEASTALGVTEEDNFLDTSAKNGISAIYTLHCGDKLKGIWSESTVITAAYKDTFPPDPVTGITLSPLRDHLRVAWSPSPDADHYRLVMKCPGKAWKEVAGNIRETHTLIAPTSCRVGIIAVDEAGNESQPVTRSEKSNDR